MRTVLAVATTCWLFAGCAADPEPAAAKEVFASFQQALRQRDEAACRRLLTQESAAVLASMPWDRVQNQPALQVLGARREGNALRVQVRDPAQGNAPGEFVVVREYGQLVVDLIASAALVAEVHEAANAKDVFEPRELSPADLDRIRQHELAQPPR
ncbi:MAG: hypothetical protein WAT39_13630 [Planctomycetota bacterium]